MGKRKPYYLKMYKEWMAKKSLPQVSKYFNGGLCGAGLSKNAGLFEPTDDDFDTYYPLTRYWADGIGSDGYSRLRDFTPLRQTIVLFLAAMNNEL